MMGDDLIRRAKEVLTPALAIHTDIVAKKAQGIYVEDAIGKRYMDFSSGLATTNTGHNHSLIVEAIKKQAESFIHSVCIFYYEPLTVLAENLGKVTPKGIDMFFFSNSGAEAVEGSLKLARFVIGRKGIIAFTGGFHGRTYGAASLTSSNIRYRKSYVPFLPGVYHSSYPYCFRCYFGQRQESCSMDCYEYLERLFKQMIPSEEVACMIIEPVLGEGGYVVPPEAFLRNLRQLCDRWGILLILDEVQSGMGRTGRWFASEHFGITPDIMTIAKGIASGLPLSAVASTKTILSKWPPGAHGTTFGGNPVACTAAIATIKVIKEENLLKNATLVGGHAIERLNTIKGSHPCVGDVRGLGLMIGIEFVKNDKEPYTEGLKNILNYCLERGLVLIESGVDRNVIRFAPPLIIRKEEMDRSLDILEEAIGKAN